MAVVVRSEQGEQHGEDPWERDLAQRLLALFALIRRPLVAGIAAGTAIALDDELVDEISALF